MSFCHIINDHWQLEWNAIPAFLRVSLPELNCNQKWFEKRGAHIVSKYVETEQISVDCIIVLQLISIEWLLEEKKAKGLTDSQRKT